ncbi:MAG: hypothetical protein U0R44_03435 [Candidatus Micrarchaeia archaeon]
MIKKPPKARTVPQKADKGYSASDVAEMEKLAIEKANKAISAIENAIAVWDASAVKPEDMAPRMAQLKNFLEALTSWERNALKSIGKEDMLKERVERLKEFASICYAYS